MSKLNFLVKKLFVLIFSTLLVTYLSFDFLGAQTNRIGSNSGLPIPRFVSLKSNDINVRNGPDINHNIKWKFVRKGIPVEIIEEFDNWRRVRDWEGETGWVHGNLLSGKRTVFVKPWGEPESEPSTVPLREDPDDTAKIIAELEPLVLADISECKQKWCEIAGRDLNGKTWDGWIEQSLLFGVYVDETIE